MDSPDNNDLNSLEDTGTKAEAAAPGSTPEDKGGDTKKKKSNRKIQDLITHVNIYLLLFILIVVLAAGLVFIGFQRNKKESATPTTQSQELTQEALDKINGSEAKVGDPKQTLTIESNTIIDGKVLIRDSLDVAGTIKVGGALSLPGITVSGTSNFDQIQANNLSVAGDMTVQGQVAIQKTLSVTQGATFGGAISAPQITVQSLQLSGDLTFNRHIDAGGATPNKSDGSAVGAGGTVTVSGTDTAGTVTVNTGGGPPVGCFVTVTFTQPFSSTPHVVITPVGSAAAGINYYVNRTTSNFQICTTNSAPAGQSFSFDYVAID